MGLFDSKEETVSELSAEQRRLAKMCLRIVNKHGREILKDEFVRKRHGLLRRFHLGDSACTIIDVVGYDGPRELTAGDDGEAYFGVRLGSRGKIVGLLYDDEDPDEGIWRRKIKDYYERHWGVSD